MAVVLKTGASYAFVVFLIGFVTGAIRILLIVPRFGETLAVCLEAPIVLAISWQVSRWITSRFALSDSFAPRLATGLTALAVLMSFELALGVLAFGRSLAQYFAGIASTAGEIGLIAQVALAFIPLVQSLQKNKRLKL